jgi:hypothetical protein
MIPILAWFHGRIGSMTAADLASTLGAMAMLAGASAMTELVRRRRRRQAHRAGYTFDGEPPA